jgi:excisionase family DNA binding protein
MHHGQEEIMTDILSGLLEAPERIVQVREEEVAALLAEVATLHIRLAALAELLLLRVASRPNTQVADDRLLQVDEAANLLGVDERWIRRRARTLPFVRRLSGKAIRVSEEGLKRWVSARRAA